MGAENDISSENDRDNKKLSFLDRIKTRFIAELAYWIILLIGCSLRWRVEGWSHLEEIHRNGKRFVGVTWHNRIFLTAYFFRNRNIIALISRSRDGEYFARICLRLGSDVARGSSSRGGRSAVVEVLRALRRKQDVFITLDGPKGPRYVAKPGAAFIARKSGHPVMPVCYAVEKKWILRSWDGFIIPKPFSRASVVIGPPIEVGSNADEKDIERIQEQIQQSMDTLCDRCDSYWDA